MKRGDGMREEQRTNGVKTGKDRTGQKEGKVHRERKKETREKISYDRGRGRRGSLFLSGIDPSFLFLIFGLSSFPLLSLFLFFETLNFSLVAERLLMRDMRFVFEGKIEKRVNLERDRER